MLRSDVAVLGAFEHGTAHSLAQLDRNDVLLVAGFSPHTRRTIQAAEIAAKHGVAVIAITDSHASPLVPFARLSFFTPARAALISNSMGATFVFAEALVSMVALELGDSVIGELEKREDYIKDERIEI